MPFGASTVSDTDAHIQPLPIATISGRFQQIDEQVNNRCMNLFMRHRISKKQNTQKIPSQIKKLH